MFILSYIQKSPKRIFPIFFWSRIFLCISKYHIHILSYILFSAFSARDFGFQRQYFSFSTAVSAISTVICHFLAGRPLEIGKSVPLLAPFLEYGGCSIYFLCYKIKRLYCQCTSLKIYACHIVETLQEYIEREYFMNEWLVLLKCWALSNDMPCMIHILQAEPAG
jgi:hypothetical protein